jgi:hypothetical protein
MSINYDQTDYFDEIAMNPLSPSDVPHAPDEHVNRRSYCTFGNSLVLLVIILQCLQIGAFCYLYLQYAPAVSTIVNELPVVANLIGLINETMIRVNTDLSVLEAMLNQSTAVYSRIDRDLNVAEFFLNQTGHKF